MKKLLLSCFLALGISSNAQYNYTGDFEDPGYNTTTYKQFGGGTRVAAAACNGGFGGQLAISSTVTQTGYMVDLSTISQTGNGQKADVTVNYKKGATVTGSLSLAYFEFNPSTNNWTIITFGTPVTLTATATTTCSVLSGTIPSGALQPDKVYGVGVWFVRSGGTSGNIFVDDIHILQETVTNVPACTTISNPTNGATISAGNLALSWAAAPQAVNYKVAVGTTLGGSELFNGTVAGTTMNITLAKNTTYYATVTPSNTVGDATGCTGISFTTNDQISYCGPITSTSPSATYPISSVTLNGTTKTSAATVGSPAYEDFTSTVFNLNPGATFPINVIGTGVGTNRFGMTVFIDWNEDGDFNDANEKYFTTAPLIGGTGAAVNLTGDIAVPAGVTIGNKRMRVKYNFNSSTTSLNDALANPCGNMGNGQAEDYTISVTIPTTPPACTTFINPVQNQTVSAGATTISWNPSSGASGYKLSVGTSSGASDIFSGTVTGTSQVVTLSGAGVTYYAKVVPTNSVGDATGCTEISFKTCSAVSAFPLNVSFDTNSTPACWTNEPVSGTAKWTFVTANGNSSITPQSAPYMAEFRTTNPGDKARLISVPMDITSLTNPTLKFSYANVNWVGDIDELRVFYKTSASGAWTQIGTDYITENTTWKTITLDLPNKSSEYYIAFEGTSNYARGIDLDDVSIYAGPTAAVSNVNKNQISVYPNPFKDILKISDVKNVKSITVSDVSGRQVKTLAPAAELNLSSLKSGLYIVNLHMNDGTVKSVKAIKK